MRQNRLALAVVCGAVSLVVSQQLVLSLVLPQLSADLRATPSDVQWILDCYPITLAALLLPGGALADRWGRKRLLTAGLVVMAVTAAGTALADGPAGVVAWRTACAVGAAVVFPATLSTLTTTFPAAQRAKAVAAWALAATLGGFGGFFAAGTLLEFWSWRSICWGSAGLALVLAVAVAAFVPESERNPHAVLDPTGSALAVAGVGGITFGIILAGDDGLSDARVLVGPGVGLVAMWLFLRRQWFTEHPLLNVRALAGAGVGIGLVGTTALFFAAYSAAFVTVQYLSIVHGFSALQVGTTLLSYTSCAPLLVTAGNLARRFGNGPVVAVGLVVMALGDLLFATFDVGTGLGAYVAIGIVFGAGIGLIQGPATVAISEALPVEEQGLASAVNDITREVGAALGLAITGAVLTSHLGHTGTPAARFMAAWTPTCVALATCAGLCAVVVLALHRQLRRASRRRGRHAAPPSRTGGRTPSPVRAPLMTR